MQRPFQEWLGLQNGLYCSACVGDGALWKTSPRRGCVSTMIQVVFQARSQTGTQESNDDAEARRLQFRSVVSEERQVAVPEHTAMCLSCVK